MPLESVTHISDLVVTNPTSTDPKSEGDNHLRAIKTALKTDFPNISGPVTKTHTQLNNTLDKTGDTMTGALNVSGNVLVTGSGVLGYGAGSGGTVTQATSKSTAVTLNKPCGRITTDAANLNAGATVTFIVNNSSVSADDVVFVQPLTTSPKYRADVYYTDAGGRFDIALTNISGGALAEAVSLKFFVHNVVTS